LFPPHNRRDPVNTSGVPRLTKFYTPPRVAPGALVERIFTLVSRRAPTQCNFLEAPDLDADLRGEGASGDKDGASDRLRVVYRNYATLYFVFVVDAAESELGVLDLIQVFVESLDRAFENVCELDLVFHFDEAHHVLSEVVQGGLVLETNVDEIESAVRTAVDARKKSFQEANPLAFGAGPGMTSRNAGSALQTPLGWLTGKLAGVGAR
jgi:AP-3 complex subunit sigma